MSAEAAANPFRALLASLGAPRQRKPRASGLTVVIDKSFGPESVREFIAVAGPYVDVVKLTSATSLFYAEGTLRAKIELLTGAGIDVMPGGTLAEAMLWQGQYPAYLRLARQLGFTGIEVSDGTIEMDDELRKWAIGLAVEAGFKVVSEVGRKEWSEQTGLADLVTDLRRDLALGAHKVVVEAMEFGVGVGIVDREGNVSEAGMRALIEAAGTADNIIWEAPLRQQQEFFISQVGPNANLGNIPPQEVLVVEATRWGLTGLPFRDAYRGHP